MKKIKLCSIGECMVEISNIKNNIYKQSIAGDTLNFCSYLDKSFFDVYFFTALGNTLLSRETLKFISNRNILNNFIFTEKNKEIGLYLIHNDNSGEKKFFYWRDNSAAKLFFNKVNYIKYIKFFKKFNYIYFSGITLSILNNSSLSKFSLFLMKLKKQNIKVVFDLNIRISRWKIKNLENSLKLILPHVDMLFASGEDLSFLKKNNNVSIFHDLINQYNISHGIYRKNATINYSFFNKKKYIKKNKVVKKIVDSSGAGDGYNAAYLTNFIKTNNPQLALNQGSKLGSRIVMKKGAII